MNEIKLMFCLRRREGMSREEFQAYWHDEHGALGLRLQEDLGFSRYVQSHTLTAPLNDALQASRGAPAAYDGVVELYFPSVEAVEATFETRSGRAAARQLLRDEHSFVDIAGSPIFVVRERPMS